MWKPNCVLTGSEISFFFSANAILSNSGTVWPFEIVSLPPFAFEPVSSEYFFASAAKSPPFFELRCRSSSACAFVFDQDVPHVAALRLAVLRLVLLVVLLDLLVGHLHVVGDLREDLLRDELRADVAAHLRLRSDPASSSCFSYFFLSPPKYCFLICSSRASTSLSVTSMSSSSASCSNCSRWTRNWTAWFFSVWYSCEPGLRELPLLVLVALLRLREQRVVLALRDLLAVDDARRRRRAPRRRRRRNRPAAKATRERERTERTMQGERSS